MQIPSRDVNGTTLSRDGVLRTGLQVALPWLRLLIRGHAPLQALPAQAAAVWPAGRSTVGLHMFSWHVLSHHNIKKGGTSWKNPLPSHA